MVIANCRSKMYFTLCIYVKNLNIYQCHDQDFIIIIIRLLIFFNLGVLVSKWQLTSAHETFAFN